MNEKEVIAEGKLNEVIIKETKRKNGTIRVQQDFQFCPTLAEQHTSHLTDINYLMTKYKPDELAAYIAARAAHRQEIVGHDFSQEPSLQDGMTKTYRLRQAYEKLPDEIKRNFKNHVEFLKFIDNPANQEKMIKLGLMTKEEIVANTSDVQTTTMTKEEKEDQPSAEKRSSSKAP